MFFNACKNCHSNETTWPWYTQYTPASWLIQSDVDEGRSKFNMSEWGRQGANHGDEAAEKLKKGDMPPWFYLPAHPEARLSQADKEALISGLMATFNKKETTLGRRRYQRWMLIGLIGPISPICPRS